MVGANVRGDRQTPAEHSTIFVTRRTLDTRSQPTTGTGSAKPVTLGKIEAIEVHDLVPRGHEFMHNIATRADPYRTS
jgi:hypothetical protein